MVDLRVTVDGADSEIARNWNALSVSLGVGFKQDTAALTISAVGDLALPRSSAVLRFVVDGADLGEFTAREVSGGSRDGHIVIECAAVDPEAAARRPRDREWETQSLGSIARTMAGAAGLTPVVNGEIGGMEVPAQPQLGVSDLAFLQRLTESRGGRVILQEGRLIVALGDQPGAALPALRVDLLADGAWVDWRRGWSDVQQRVVAAYLLEDGATIETVEAGSGGTVRRLPTVYPSRDAALADARRHLAAGEVSRDYVEIRTGLTPTAQVLQPLEMVGADRRIPVGFPALVVHSVQHTIGRSAAQTVITARPGAAGA